MNLYKYWLVISAIGGCCVGGAVIEFGNAGDSSDESPADNQSDIGDTVSILHSLLLPRKLEKFVTITMRPSATAPANDTNLELFCEPEEFVHFLVVDENEALEIFNTWQRAHVGQRMGLQKVCLQPNGLPLTRLCRYNADLGRAEWEDISLWPRRSCIQPSRQCQLSNKLNNLHGDLLWRKSSLRTQSELTNFSTQLYELLSETKYRVLPADVHLTSQILRELTAGALDPELAANLVSICSILMAADAKVLRLAAALNATNALLATFESYVDAVASVQVPEPRCGMPMTTTHNSSRTHNAVEVVDLANIGIRAHLSANVSVFYVNPRCANISGIAVFATDTEQGSSAATHRVLLHAALPQFRYRFIYMNESTQTMMQEADLEVAAFVPTKLWQYVLREMPAKSPLLVLKVYAHDALFVEPTLVQNHKPSSKILSISIPGFTGRFPEKLPFLLRKHHENLTISTSNSGCAYWNYTTWINNDVATDVTGLSVLRVPVIQCGTQHLTQFSYLMSGTYKQYDPSDDVLVTPLHERVLDIISLVGCSLSLLGLVGIWLTAALQPTWRKLASTKVLLHLCFALTLQMILFLFVNTDDLTDHLLEYQHYSDCIALGALMQYTILALFSWMLIVALLQFQRYVTVIGVERPRHYILKAALLAWGVPLLPTLLVVVIAPNSYIPSEYELQEETGICYPSGLALTLGVVTPVGIIVLANLFIFIYVFYSISRSLNQATQRTEKLMVVKQIRLSVLLFFLLGLSWIFGVLAYMHAGLVFSYLFCLTATMQGAVLFVYFVLLDEAARKGWLQLLCPGRMQKLAQKKRTAELHSMNTASTNVESREQ